METKKRLGEMLMEAGVIDETQLQAALGHQRKWGGRLGHALVELKLTTENRIVEALAAKFGYEVTPARALEPGPVLESALKLVPREFAVRNNLVPYAADTSSITIAMSDPANIAVVDEIRFRTGRRVKITLAGDRQIAAVLRRQFGEEAKVQSIDLDLDEAPSGATIVESFGGGSTEALEEFFSQPPLTAPQAPPSPETRAGPPAGPRPAAAVRSGPAPASPSAAASREARPAPPPARSAPARGAAGPEQLGAGATPARALSPRPGEGTASPLAARPPSPARAGPARPVPTSPPAPEVRSGPDAAARAPIAAAPGVAIRASPAPSAGGAASARLARGAEERKPPPPAPPAAPAEEVTGSEPILATEVTGSEPILATEVTGSEPILASEFALEDVTPGTPQRLLSEKDLAILDVLQELAHGSPPDPGLMVKPAQLAAALVRLLIRKRVITEQEFLDELCGK